MNTLDKQIILDVYREHCLEQSKYLRHGGTIQEFINKIKTDKEFSEKWGLVIEERELSLEERLDLLKKLEIFQERAIDNAKSEMIHSLAVSHNIPTKQLTITYNDQTITYNVKTIETYE
jgi:hypothetical protein